jgi:hypothetical protein
MRRAICILSVLFVISACAPTIDYLHVDAGADVNKVNVRASISHSEAVSIGAPSLEVGYVEPGGLDGLGPTQYVSAGTLSNSGGGVYGRDGLVMPTGLFRAKVTVPYSALFQAPGTVSRETLFTVKQPDGCFFFDSGTLGGWSADGFFHFVDTSTGPQRQPLCAGQSPQLTINPAANYPTGYTSPVPGVNFGGLTVEYSQLINTCINQPTPTPEKGFVILDLNSPSLESRPGWNAAQGFEFQGRQVALAGSPPATVKAQLFLIDAADGVHVQRDESGQPVFYDLPNTYGAFSFNRTGTSIKRVRIRLFFTGAAAPDEIINMANVDRVCPR